MSGDEQALLPWAQISLGLPCGEVSGSTATFNNLSLNVSSTTVTSSDQLAQQAASKEGITLRTVGSTAESLSEQKANFSADGQVVDYRDNITVVFHATLQVDNQQQLITQGAAASVTALASASDSISSTPEGDATTATTATTVTGTAAQSLSQYKDTEVATYLVQGYLLYPDGVVDQFNSTGTESTDSEWTIVDNTSGEPSAPQHASTSMNGVLGRLFAPQLGDTPMDLLAHDPRSSQPDMASQLMGTPELAADAASHGDAMLDAFHESIATAVQLHGPYSATALADAETRSVQDGVVSSVSADSSAYTVLSRPVAPGQAPLSAQASVSVPGSGASASSGAEASVAVAQGAASSAAAGARAEASTQSAQLLALPKVQPASPGGNQHSIVDIYEMGGYMQIESYASTLDRSQVVTQLLGSVVFAHSEATTLTAKKVPA